MSIRFRISISKTDRENNDRIYVPLSPKQLKVLKEKLLILQSDEEALSSKPGLINLFHEALKDWEKIL